MIGGTLKDLPGFHVNPDTVSKYQADLNAMAKLPQDPSFLEGLQTTFGNKTHELIGKALADKFRPPSWKWPEAVTPQERQTSLMIAEHMRNRGIYDMNQFVQDTELLAKVKQKQNPAFGKIVPHQVVDVTKIKPDGSYQKTKFPVHQLLDLENMMEGMGTQLDRDQIHIMERSIQSRKALPEPLGPVARWALEQALGRRMAAYDSMTQALSCLALMINQQEAPTWSQIVHIMSIYERSLGFIATEDHLIYQLTHSTVGNSLYHIKEIYKQAEIRKKCAPVKRDQGHRMDFSQAEGNLNLLTPKTLSDEQVVKQNFIAIDQWYTVQRGMVHKNLGASGSWKYFSKYSFSKKQKNSNQGGGSSQ